MTQSKHEAREQARRVAQNRDHSRRGREERRRRLVLITTFSAIIIAVLASVSGVLYDRVYIPSKSVASVAGVTLTRSGYVIEKRLTLASQVAQNVLLAAFGGQFAERFQQQNPYLESQVAELNVAAEPDGSIVQSWVDRQLLIKGAEEQYQISLDEGAADQAFIRDYGQVFGNLPAANATAEPTRTPGGLEPTMTIRPTQGAPTASPDATKAGALVAPILDQVYKNYVDSLKANNITGKLTRDDFQQALQIQYGRQALIEAVKEKLVPADGFAASTEPTGYNTSHILVRVDAPAGASEADVDALFAAAKPQAEAILAKIVAGADFAATAKAESQDPTSAKNDGKMDVFDKTGRSVAGTQFDPAYVAAATALTEGAYTTQLVKTQFGWHIIKLNELSIPTVEDQLATARSEAFDAWLPTLAAKYSVTYAVEPTATAVPEPTAAAPLAPTAALAGYPTDTPEPPATQTAAALTTSPTPSATATATETVIPTATPTP
ncbi:MAG: hypothetical protein RLZZ297_582 [Chloroflexota bacterium]|jgi:parvulin-like peptidyl-prolyl isomerase